MNLLFIYSSKCPHSRKLMNYDVFEKLNKINIDNPQNLKHVPKYIDSVPVLIINNNNNINILKNNDLMMWFNKNSNQNNSKHVNSNQNNKPENILEANILDASFSSNFTFLDNEGSNDDLLENNYSNLNSGGSQINGSLEENTNIDIKSQKKEENSLDNAYQKLMKSREDYKPIERI